MFKEFTGEVVDFVPLISPTPEIIEAVPRRHPWFLWRFDMYDPKGIEVVTQNLVDIGRRLFVPFEIYDAIWRKKVRDTLAPIISHACNRCEIHQGGLTCDDTNNTAAMMDDCWGRIDIFLQDTA